MSSAPTRVHEEEVGDEDGHKLGHERDGEHAEGHGHKGDGGKQWRAEGGRQVGPGAAEVQQPQHRRQLWLQQWALPAHQGLQFICLLKR